MSHGFKWKIALASLMWSLFAKQVLACPFCSTETGKQVRTEIFGNDFALNVAQTLISFPLFVAIIGLIYVGFPRRKDRDNG